MGVSNNNTVKAEMLKEDGTSQRWKKGNKDNEGYFVLISSTKKVLTATSADGLEIKGIFEK